MGSRPGCKHVRSFLFVIPAQARIHTDGKPLYRQIQGGAELEPCPGGRCAELFSTVEDIAGRDWHTDQGKHTFDFTICAEKNLESGKLNKLARQQAQPPVVFDRYEGMDRPPWGNSPPRPLWLASEQRAVADGKMTGPREG